MPEDKVLPHHHDSFFENLKEPVPDAEDFARAANIFKQLGDKNRARIFWILCHGEECVINISALMGMSSPAVSHHLKTLKNAGLVTTRRNGKEVYYKASESDEVAMLHLMIEKVIEISCPLLHRKVSRCQRAE